MGYGPAPVSCYPRTRASGARGFWRPRPGWPPCSARARLDVDHGREREAALQLLVALDATIAELSADPNVPLLAERLTELRGRREPVAAAAQAALGGPLGEADVDTVTATLARVEAALKARVAAGT